VASCELCGEVETDTKRTFVVGGRLQEGFICEMCNTCDLCGKAMKWEWDFEKHEAVDRGECVCFQEENS
jgi:hypothetical protein